MPFLFVCFFAFSSLLFSLFNFFTFFFFLFSFFLYFFFSKLVQTIQSYFKREGNDIKKVSHFHIDVNRKPEAEFLPILSKIYPKAGCVVLPKGYDEGDRDVWGRMCFFSKMLQSFVIGGTGLLHEKRIWLRQ